MCVWNVFIPSGPLRWIKRLLPRNKTESGGLQHINKIFVDLKTDIGHKLFSIELSSAMQSLYYDAIEIHFMILINKCSNTSYTGNL